MNFWSWLVLVVLVVLLIFMGIGVARAARVEAAVAYATENELWCGKDYCAVALDDSLAVPAVAAHPVYDPAMGRFLLDLVARVEHAVSTPPLQNPSTLTHHLDIYNRANPQDAPVFATLWTSRSDATLGFLAVRGTVGKGEWLQDFMMNQTNNIQHPGYSQTAIQARLGTSDLIVEGRVHQGFQKVWLSVRDQLYPALQPLGLKRLFVAGHSLGAAIATLASYNIAQDFPTLGVVGYALAPPRVGDSAFCALVDQAVPIFNLVNTLDVIPTMPLAVTPNLEDHTKPYFYSDLAHRFYVTVNHHSLLNNHVLTAYIAFFGDEELLLPATLG